MTRIGLEVIDEVWRLLETLEITGEIDSEREFHEILLEYFDTHSEYEVESEPNTGFGRPDILIGGVVALELKVKPNRNERNRLVGQVLDYSRQWFTIIVLWDTPQSKQQELQNLLADKGFGDLPIFAFRT